MELNWCNEDIKIPAPLNKVKIPKKICKKTTSPKINIGLNKITILFLYTVKVIII